MHEFLHQGALVDVQATQGFLCGGPIGGFFNVLIKLLLYLFLISLEPPAERIFSSDIKHLANTTINLNNFCTKYGV